MNTAAIVATNTVAANPLTKVELRFEAQKLPNLDVGSKSDPQVPPSPLSF